MPSQPQKNIPVIVILIKYLSLYLLILICQVDKLLCYYCIYKTFPHQAYVILIIVMYFVRSNQFIYFKDVCA